MSNLNSQAGELKSQGAAMAAQDPDNKVTAEDAEGVMTDESKKAGIPAFRFDPDATPEEKAAQARSVTFGLLSTLFNYGSWLMLSSTFHQAFIVTRSPKALALLPTLFVPCPHIRSYSDF